MITIIFFIFSNLIITESFNPLTIRSNKNLLKMSSYSPSNIIKTIGNQGISGSEWTYNDFITNIEKHNIDGATIITKNNQVSGLIAIDNNYQETINPENLHTLKTTIPSISDTIIHKLTAMEN